MDVRKLLESKDIDAVTIATPNHWHSLMAVWACQAGKDVYVEKPVSHNVWEGRKVVEAAAKYNRIVAGRHAVPLGRGAARARRRTCAAASSARSCGPAASATSGARASARSPGPQPIPAGVDYDLCCGPAPLEPLRRKQLHYDWHWVWATGNGDIGNQGIHEMDMCRWMLGEEKLPPRVFSIGGRFGYDDDGETPNTQIVFLDYAAAPLIFEVRGLPARRPASSTWTTTAACAIGIAIECENGYFRGRRRAAAWSTTGRQEGEGVHGLRRRHAHGELHPGRPQPEGAGPEGADRGRRTSRRPSATSATSPTAWARRWPHRRSRRGSSSRPEMTETSNASRATSPPTAWTWRR